MPKRNVAWILVVGLIAVLFWQMPHTIAGRDSLYSAFGPLVEVRAQIHKRAAEPVDDARLGAAASRAGITAMIRELNDPHAAYLDPETFIEFRKQTEGVFGGVGVEIYETNDGLKIVSCIHGSPADRAGFGRGDVIVAIDGDDTAELGLVESVHRLNGPPGTSVRLRVKSAGAEPRDHRLQRAEIEINPVRGWMRSGTGGWHVWLDRSAGIACIRLSKFMPQSVRRLDQAIEPLLESGLRGLILDLRENTGGLLRSAIDVADRFLDRGIIVATRGRTSDARQWFAQREGTYPPFFMIVLVNGTTASAAEIVAGALHDHKRALIVGERTYGKGSLQDLVPLEDGRGAIKLTTAYYYLPSGRCLQRRSGAGPDEKWGVEPNLVVPMDPAMRERWRSLWYAADLESESPEAIPAAPDDADDAAVDDQASELLERLLSVDPQLEQALRIMRRELTSEAAESNHAHQP
jgi:carboxyl-terminal processing protease